MPRSTPWSLKDREGIDQALDLLTGVFLNTKVARIRLDGYYHALHDLPADAVLAALQHRLRFGMSMPTPGQIRAWVQRKQSSPLKEGG